MKNIHILPTDKPSRLYLNSENKIFITDVEMKCGNTQNIYITSDEEIKFNEYVIQVNFEKTNTQVIRCTTEFQVKIANDEDGSFTKKKIILTTDQDLIKNGVQPIDDKFLEWFVKNPSCEEVPIMPKLFGHPYIIWIEGLSFKEEPKQETLEDITLEEVFGSAYCQFSVVENKLAILYRNQEQLLKAIKFLSKKTNESKRT
jgi:hypothetical protein